MREMGKKKSRDEGESIRFVVKLFFEKQIKLKLLNCRNEETRFQNLN